MTAFGLLLHWFCALPAGATFDTEQVDATEPDVEQKPPAVIGEPVLPAAAPTLQVLFDVLGCVPAEHVPPVPWVPAVEQKFVPVLLGPPGPPWAEHWLAPAPLPWALQLVAELPELAPPLVAFVEQYGLVLPVEQKTADPLFGFIPAEQAAPADPPAVEQVPVDPPPDPPLTAEMTVVPPPWPEHADADFVIESS